jgi:hypothetical protein
MNVVNGSIKSLMIREETSEANFLIKVLDKLVSKENSSLEEADISLLKYNKARFLQLISNFEKADEIFSELIKKDSQWNYVYYTASALCRLYKKDVKYIEYPDNQTDVTNLYLKLEEERDLFEKAVVR